MTDTAVPGRHRAVGRHNPVTELTGMIARAGESGVKASAVVAASGGLLAAFALPAQAASSTGTKTTVQSAALIATTSKGAAFSAMPASLTLASTATAARAVVVPVVVAPSTLAPVAADEVGVSGIGAVEKPPPPPPPAPEPVAAPVAATTVNTAGSAAATKTPTVTPPAPVSGGILGIAASLSGIWYVYGGSTPAGFDCSGYTKYVFAQAGITLPRTADQQMRATTRVSNPQPGDLVFFGPSNAYHVGIYAGNGMMYDSPRTGVQSGLHPIWSTDVVYGRP